MIIKKHHAKSGTKKKKKWGQARFAVWSMAGCMAYVSPVVAEEIDYFSLSPEELFNATVTSATKTEDKWWNTPAAIYVLTGEDIMRSGATSLPEVLRLVPGVNVAQVGANSWAVGVRGFNATLSNKLLVLMDGRDLYNPLFSGVYWNAQDTVLEDIERIEVIRGPGAALWGANAVNGVINIITKKAQDTQGNMVSAIHGNQENGIVTARHGGKIGDKGHYRVFGKYLNRDDQRAVNGGGADDEWDAYRSGFRADIAGNDPRDSFTFKGDIYLDSTDRYTSSYSLQSPYVWTETETILSRGWNLQGTWQRAMEDGGKFTMQSYVDYSLRDQRLLEDERTSFDVDAQYELPTISRHNLIVGGRYRYTTDDLSGSSGVSFAPASRSDNLFSGFIQDKITLLEDAWYLTLGSKFEHNDYTGFELQPNARLQWHINPSQTLWASVARAVRTPNRLEHGLNLTSFVSPPGALFPLPTEIEFAASPDFDSEELTAFELGYRHQWNPRVTLDVAAFYNDYKDLSVALIEPPQLISNGVDPDHYLLSYMVHNGMTGETYGFESALEWRPKDYLRLSASYSLLEMQLHAPQSGGFNLETAEGQSPHHQVNLRSQWDITKNTSFDTMLYYVDSLSAYQTDDYWRLDLRWGWRIMKGLEFNLVGQNLLDDAHREFSSPTSVSATEIRRSIYGRFVWRF